MKELLAEHAHKMWSGWMKYMFSKSHRIDGVVVIPAWAVDRWTRQMNTPYKDLPKSEKESDRAEADKIMELIQEKK